MNLRTPVVVVTAIIAIGLAFASRSTAQDFFSPTPPVAGYSYAPAMGAPAMPPPPSLAPPPTMRNSVNGVYVAMQQPPVIVAPPVAQGFGTGVAPMAPAAPPGVMPVEPYYTQPMAADPSACWYDPQQYVKFMQSVRLRYTWLAGGEDPSEFGVNEAEAAATFAWNNWIFTNQPLLITPGFIFSMWDPPALTSPPQPVPPPASITSELPPRVYSAYLDFYWTPHITECLTAELDFRIGVYSDFESASSDAIRPQGYAALIWQTSPCWAFKGGATYINRVDIQLLPVVGVIWTPNQFTHFDFTFPNPKLSHYGWTWGCTDIWWYLAAEYGGGSWEVSDIVNGENARMDLNDIRAILGFEWTGGYLGAKGFVEVGYVFNREIVIEDSPNYNLDLDSTIMIRGGIAF